jgi:predicted kinase
MPKVIVMRGLPGSGKSTTVQSLQIAGKAMGIEVFVVSADHYFMMPGTGSYRFDASKLGEAHATCMREFIRVLEARHDDFTLIVDNTNISSVEIAPYMSVAAAFGVSAEVWTIEVKEDEFDTCADRNIHGVPRDTIIGMRDRMLREVLPPYWKQKVLSMGEGELGTIHND